MKARFPWILAGIAVVALAIRLVVMVGRELWLDETNSVLMALSERGLVDALRQDSSPPLYYWLLRAWMAVFGTGELAVRMPSVLAGAAAVGVAGWLAASRFSPRAGILAASFLAVAPAHVEYSIEARQYALGGLLVLVAAASIAGWVHRPTHRGALVAGTLLATCLYTHYFALFVAAAAVPLALWLAPRGARRSGAWIAVVPALAFAPWVPMLLAQMQRSAGFLFWLERFWERDGPLGTLGIWAGAWWFGDPFTQSLPGEPALRAIALVLLVLAAAGTLRACLGVSGGPVLWSACFASVLAAWGLSIATSPPVFIAGRLDQLVYPLFVMSVGGALDRLPRRARSVAILAVAGVLLFGSVQSFTGEPRSGARELARDLGHGDRDGVVVAVLLSRASVEYYLLGTGWDVRSFPSVYASHMGNHSPEELERIDLGADARDLAHAIADDERSRIVVVVPVFAANSLTPPLFAAFLEAGYVPDHDRGRYRPRRGDELAAVEFRRFGEGPPGAAPGEPRESTGAPR